MPHVHVKSSDGSYVHMCTDCGAASKHGRDKPFIRFQCLCKGRQVTFTPPLTVGGPREPAKPREPRPATTATNRADCLHILEPTGDSVLQSNCGCPGNKLTSVWDCSKFGRVAPFAKGEPADGVRACQKCASYEKEITGRE